jgi:NAD(P)-dependent dehydrogenase (short-subunit alcohol dehydrogenase family)
MHTALVTGANRGIGLVGGRQLADLGLSVILTARDRGLGEAAAAELATGGRSVRFEALDVADPGAAAALAERLARDGVAVDVLVNNAGVYPAGRVLDTTDEAMAEALAVNYWGAFHCCRAFVPGMVAGGYGRVVNVSSGAGSFDDGIPGPAAYGISKAALNALTLKLALEVPDAVKVNAVCPGWVRTRMGGDGAPRDVARGAETVVWAATLRDDGPSGGFFRDRRSIPW